LTAIRRELKQHSKALAQKTEVVVANKIDLDPESKIAKNLGKRIKKMVHPISAVAGTGIKQLCELLWKEVKETREPPGP
jgi:GTPase involved in cell partitioning and DNA repair